MINEVLQAENLLKGEGIGKGITANRELTP